METPTIPGEATPPEAPSTPHAWNGAIEFIRLVVLVGSGALMLTGFVYGFLFYASAS